MFPVFGAGLVPEKRVEVFRGTDPAADSKTGYVHMKKGGHLVMEVQDGVEVWDHVEIIFPAVFLQELC